MVALNEVEMQEPGPGLNMNTNLNFISGSIREDNHIPMNLQQHHFGGNGNIPSPALHNMGSLGRKVNNHNGNSRSYQRLSTFRPLQGQHADLVRECLEERLSPTGAPTYETIDPHHLSHLGYSADYGNTPGSGGSSGSSINGRNGSGCIETILPEARCYATTGRGQLYHSGTHENDYRTVQSNNHGDLRHLYNGLSNKKLDKEEEFTISNAFLIIVSLISYVMDILSDVVVCYFMYTEGNRWWFGLTLALILIPSITVNAFSIRWYMQDKNRNMPNSLNVPKLGALAWIIKSLAHILFLGPVLRYFDLLRYGFKSRGCRKQKLNDKRDDGEWHLSTLQQPPSLSTLQRSNGPSKMQPIGSSNKKNNDEDCHFLDYYLLSIHEDRDTALLSLLRSFMESAPMAVLQIYILVAKNSGNEGLTPSSTKVSYIQGVSVIASLFELSWSLASYHRAFRRSVPDKRNMSNIGTITQFLWRFFVIGSRLLAIALFTSEFGYWLFPIAIGHWGIMTIWVMHQGTRFCDTERGEPRPCEEYLFNMVVGAIYLICFLNVKDEPTRFKYLAYYIIVFLENSLLITTWYVKTSTDPVKSLLWFHVPSMVGVIAAFLLGMAFMLIYYRFFHPNGRPLLVNRAAKCC